jgi:hypothetical protein
MSSLYDCRVGACGTIIDPGSYGEPAASSCGIGLSNLENVIAQRPASSTIE